MSAAQARLAAVSGALSASHPQGLLKDEVAIITGVSCQGAIQVINYFHAAQGIGRSVALLFAKEGAKVVVSDLDEKKAQAVVDEIKKAGGQAIAVQGDVTSADFPKKLIKATVDAFGSINHIVNNAGFTFDKMFHTMTDETYELILKVHNIAPFRIVREAAPYIRSKDPKAIAANRSIVNVSSVAGLHGNVGQANYATAKAGVIGLTKTLAKELGAFGVRSNVVAFGHIMTRLTQDKGLGAAIEVDGKKIALGIPQKPAAGGSADASFNPTVPLQNRAGSAEEAAQAVLFLCSPLASYISGHTLEVTGGMGI